MAGGDLLTCGRVIYVLYAVLAQHKTPVGFCLIVEIGNDVFVNSCGLIKLTSKAQVARYLVKQ